MMAGSHFDPGGRPHGNPAAPDHHAGDVPMLEADASGHAALTANLDATTIGQGAAVILGKAVIVHKDADDYKTQPTANRVGVSPAACYAIADTRREP